MKQHFLFLSCTFLTPLFAFCQYTTSGLSLDEKAHDWFDAQIKRENTSLVTGTYREITRKLPKSHPFLISDKWVEGSMHYMGQTYNNVSLLYDMEQDEILFRHPQAFAYNMQPIKPIQKEISWFMMEGMLFKYIDRKLFYYNEGFYEVRYEGENIIFLSKRIRTVVTEPEYMYANNDVNILIVGEEHYRIKNRFLLYRLFKQSKKSIRKYIKEHSVSFKNDNDSGLVSLVKYCDTLTPNE